MVSVRQVKAARTLLGWSQDDLARRSGMSKPTIARLETADGELRGYSDTREKIVASLRAAGVVFIDEGASSVRGGPGVRLVESRRDEGLRPEELTSENDD
jgi:transcriptional regulator with XRE-family HTH domain